MARHVFYSFHYQKDISRVMTVRNRWVSYGNQTASGIIDHAEFEKVERQGDAAIRRWIDNQLIGTSVTIVLLGSDTLDRPYVQYEILKSIERGNPIIGVYINNIKDLHGNTTTACSKYTIIGQDKKGANIWFDEVVDDTYDYVKDDGFRNLDLWVEKAVRHY